MVPEFWVFYLSETISLHLLSGWFCPVLQRLCLSSFFVPFRGNYSYIVDLLCAWEKVSSGASYTDIFENIQPLSDQGNVFLYIRIAANKHKKMIELENHLCDPSIIIYLDADHQWILKIFGWKVVREQCMSNIWKYHTTDNLLIRKRMFFVNGDILAKCSNFA